MEEKMVHNEEEELDEIDIQNAKSYKWIYVGVFVWYILMGIWYGFAINGAKNKRDAVTQAYDFCIDSHGDFLNPKYN
jgi:hypothetical protein